MSLLVLDAELRDGRRVDVRCEGGAIATVEEAGRAKPAASDTTIVDARGGALLAGLHDHHLHLFAMAAQLRSVDVSGVGVDGLAAVTAAARRERPDGWLRVTGWNATVAGALDRHTLDRIDRRPMRVQDTTGSTWYLNSAALDLLVDGPLPSGVDVDDGGRPTGRLFRLDHWLRTRTESLTHDDVREVAHQLAAHGVTSITDATVTNGDAELSFLSAVGLPQRLTCMTGSVTASRVPGIGLGPVKIVLDDDELPGVDELADDIAEAHAAGRAIAVHCVTRVQLVMTLAALDRAGSTGLDGVGGDRIEHGAVVPPELLDGVVRHRLTVVTQPGFIGARGDQYLDHVDDDDRPWLYRLRGLLDAGVPLLGSSDAPFGPADPWTAIAAACDRRSPSGRPVGAHEALGADEAIGLFSRGMIAPRQPADLCVLTQPWSALVARPGDATVAATIARGELTYSG